MADYTITMTMEEYINFINLNKIYSMSEMDIAIREQYQIPDGKTIEFEIGE